MAPSQTLKWIESGKTPDEQDVEIEGTEPYIVGGHTASGYWIDDKRRTTLKGLYAAGDVAGGCPQKYVTGALVEGEIAAKTILEDIVQAEAKTEKFASDFGEMTTKLNQQVEKEYEIYFSAEPSFFSIEQLEEAMQKVMDTYAGGISTNYRYNEKQLRIADEKIRMLQEMAERLHAEDMDDLLHIYELRERLVVCRSVIAHLKARKETRWQGFSKNMDYPKQSEEWNKYVNSVLQDGEVKIIIRELGSVEDIRTEVDRA